MSIAKKMIAAAGAAVLLAAVSGCDLYQGINLAWNITTVAPVGGGLTRVSYTAQNLGKYDLKGVNLKIGIDVTGTGTYPVSAWTPDFNVKQNEVVAGFLDIYTGAATVYGATVISVDMDSPTGGS
ncbi:MAG TPA: hypothetical protein VFI08_07065 [Spirochaetia bacterium]|nr:hypothetical protein [Spirochaetia bacterium]